MSDSQQTNIKDMRLREIIDSHDEWMSFSWPFTKKSAASGYYRYGYRLLGGEVKRTHKYYAFWIAGIYNACLEKREWCQGWIDSIDRKISGST